MNHEEAVKCFVTCLMSLWEYVSPHAAGRIHKKKEMHSKNQTQITDFFFNRYNIIFNWFILSLSLLFYNKYAYLKIVFGLINIFLPSILFYLLSNYP